MSETSARPGGRLGRALNIVALALAIFGGTVLLVIVAINFISIVGRFLFSSPLIGDFELVEMGCAVAISSFLPLCHMRNGNVIVDFVTGGLSARARETMDAASALAYGLIAAFFTWRMFFGGRDMLRYNEETMLLQIPVWIPFVPVVISFFILSICCFYTFAISLHRIAGRA